jgi:hypothetical protein
MKEEISRILKMVEEGKIDSTKATELIEALNGKNEIAKVDNVMASGYTDKMLKVNVVSKDGDNVHVKLPVKVIKALGGAVVKIPGVSEKIGDIDMDMILQALDSEVIGKIIDVQTANGDFVEVVVE